jgi:DNA mismatch repair protein MutS
MTMIDDYFDHWEDCQKRFGKRSTVFMEVGSFMEAYQVHTEHEKVGNLTELIKILRITKTKRNKSSSQIGRKNPEMSGMPTEHFPKYLNMLINVGYTVAVYTQCPNNVDDHKKFNRRLERIYSPGTIIDDVPNIQQNYIMGILIEEIGDNLIVSMSLIDLSTGQSSLNYISNNSKDIKLVDDSICKSLISFSPKELLVCNLSDSISESEIIHRWSLDTFLYHYYSSIPKPLHQLDYQNTFLEKVYPKTKMLSPIEFLNLEKYPSLVQVYILLLDFIYEHDPLIIGKISKPIIETFSSDYLQLLGDTICQLDLIPSNNGFSLAKNNVFSLIDFTSTSMGQRLLKDRLCQPSTKVKLLRKRYIDIESMLNSDYREYEILLKGLPDIQRLHRKMFLGKLTPNEFYALDSAYEIIIKLIDKYYKDGSWENSRHYKKRKFKKFKKFRKSYNQYFNLSAMLGCTLCNISSSFFKEGINENIDNLQTIIKVNKEFLEEERIKLSQLIDPKKLDCVKLGCTEIEGHFYSCTTLRAKTLQKKSGKYQYSLTIRNNRSNAKITFDELRDKSNEIRTTETELKTKVKELYLSLLTKWVNKYMRCLEWVTTFVSEMDIITSGAKLASKYGYCQPKIEEREESFVTATQLRHPLVERIQVDSPYVPMDISIGDDQLGMILYSINSAGKSTALKALGLSIILAQSGMYVPAENYTYSPFTKLITKVLNRDNLIQGKSTFIVEISHMKNMLVRGDTKSLILGDELCSGTERPSAVALVTAMIKKFRKEKIRFILSTHFHDLVEQPELRDEKFYHLKVRIEDGQIVFDRTLEEGSGPRYYGIEIAEALDLDGDVLRDSHKIRRRLIGESNELVSKKTSRYSKKVYLDKCGVCKKKKNLHTHHILYQSEADENGNIGFIKMNAKHNLVVLCEKCHQKVHKNKLKILGYKQTDKGTILEYEKL